MVLLYPGDVSLGIIYIAIEYYTINIKTLQSDYHIFYQERPNRMKDLDFCRIGRKIRDIRIEKRLTQEYIANMADVNTSHISNIENNRVKISLPTLVHVCNALDTTIDHILAEEYTDPLSAIDQTILHELHKCDADTKERILKIIQILQ